MKLQFTTIISLTLMVTLLMVALGQADEPGVANKLAKHKLFDFARFKEMFGKKYSSMAEELSRQRIFFANAFHAFISFVSFKHKGSKMYLRLNDKSDWTKKEVNDLYGKLTGLGPSKPSAELQNAASLDEIVGELNEVVKKEQPHPFYRKIGDELKSIGRMIRSRRNVISETTSLSLDDLVREPKKVREDKGNHVPSNNRHYEPPEISSFGTEDTSFHPKSTSWTSETKSGHQSIQDMLSSVGSNDKPNPLFLKQNFKDGLEVDHRKKNCFTEVKNQGHCGSCFIFSTTALYEWHYCNQFGKTVSFSEQYPMDCGARQGIQGCVGGEEGQISKFYGQFGVELRINYPYRVHVDTCPYEPSTPENNMGYLKVNGDLLRYIDRDEMEKRIEHQPIIMGVGVREDFHQYGGGVDLGLSCVMTRGHSMVIVGHGREDGVEYWLMRNSYGPDWGEEGHYKIAKEASHCYLDGYQGAIIDSGNEPVFADAQNSQYDDTAINDRLNHYIPSSIEQKPLASDVATPASA